MFGYRYLYVNQALCINEFTDSTFNCKGALNEASCIKTGDAVLSRLSFGGKTVNDACFGLGMVLIGFTVSALVILDRNGIRYLRLGHIGSKQRRFKTSQESAAVVSIDRRSVSASNNVVP